MSLATRPSILLLFLAAVVSFSPVPLHGSASPASQVSPYVDVGGRNIYISCDGDAGPTVIFEQDLDDSGSWLAPTYSDTVEAVKENARVCFYDRAGLGNSDKASTPRTSQDVVNDLHTILTRSGLARPVVLVGMGFGAGHSILYASQYRDQVAGLVLVSPVSPELPDSIVRALPAPSRNEPGVIAFSRAFWGLIENEEGLDWSASKDQIARVTSLGDLPIVVISHDMYNPSALAAAPDSWPAVEEAYQQHQGDFLTLSTNSRHEIRSFDHPQDFPAVLTYAIQSVLGEVTQIK